MAKAFSLLHRAAALLVAVCLLVGMALPVYAAGDESLFFSADSETIPDESSTTVAETSQDPAAAGLESVSPKVDTISETDGTSPAGDGSAPSSDTQNQEETVLPEDAPNTDEEPTTEDESNTDEEPTAEDEPMMLADDFSADDGAGEPAAIAETGEASQGFIPATTTIYFAVDKDKFRDFYRVHFFAHKLDDSYLDKDMVDTGKTIDGRKIYSVTLNQADYSAGGFYRLIFQYFDDAESDSSKKFKGQFFAFGGESTDDNGNGFKKETAIDKIAGQRFDGGYLFEAGKQGNQGKAFNPAQWTRVEYYYKDTPLYFKNASGTDLNNVTAVFYKKGTDGTVITARQEIGTVGANQLYAQKILIPDNDSQFVKFTWGVSGESKLYNFSIEDYADTEKFNLTKANCFVYNDSASSWQVVGSDLLTGGKTIYFDATLSSYSYTGDPDIHQRPMPGDDKKMYCFLTGSDGSTVETVTMDEVTDSATPDRQLWSCKIPNDGKTYTAVQFSAVNDTTTPNTAQDNKTKVYTTAEIPPTLTEPCFFADDGDPTAYSQDTPVFRDGYWGEKKSRHDAESGKSATVVDIDNSGIFTRQAGTKYITSTLYDYYTDYELNGLNRDNAPGAANDTQRRYVTFEQFDRALSSAYSKSDNVKYPLYTGHFQPNDLGGNAPFSTVADGMKLCGWGKPNDNEVQRALYNTFMAVNNSAYDDNGKKIDGDFSRTFQGLVEDHTSDSSANGLPLLRAKDSTDTTKALVDPHFNEAFLQGENSFNTVLGKVYKDVSFPFTKDAVFYDKTKPDDADNAKEKNATYWYYDSSKASLYLKQDKGNGKYYLESPKDGTGDPKRGFFPFNETVPSNPDQYNYGFGAKLQFNFTLTENGKVVVGKDATSGNNIEVPIKFFFSGDDDVWVYIDGQLVLDVGGAHGKASGLLEFGKDSTVTPYVSSNKNTEKDNTMAYTTNANNKTVCFNQTSITFTKTIAHPIQLDEKLTTHTLTMFYMERGMWDSNMAVAFNFPDSNELQVEKEVNVDKVNDYFKPLFQDQKLFTFTLQNLATHYGAKPIADNDTPKPVEVGDAFNASSSPTVHTKMKQGVSPPSSSDSEEDKAKTVMWYAQGNDNGSKHRDLRYGTMTLNSALNIENRDYLSFDVYAVGNEGDGALSTNYLYLTLEDDKNNQKGCDLTNGAKSYLNTMLSGSVVMQNNQWVTVKLQLSKMPEDDGFDLTKLSKIRIGDDYQREVYFRNFVFTAKPVVKRTVGFSVEQKDIPDYGSVNRKTLMPASGAIFTSSVAGSDAQAVDTDGTFDLQAGETVTFTDQFRRGSYISLQETENTALYDTHWEVYENGKLVNPPLQDKGTQPEDGRTEAYDTKVSKPTDANTLVFRSYAAPEEEFPKLKVRFINTVKVGTLVIEKKEADGETALTGKSYTFTVTFSNVGGIGLGGVEPMTITVPIGESRKITGIPIGTRFRVVETPAADSSLQSVTCDATDKMYDVDNGVRGTVTSDNTPVTATFTNTAHQLMDITVEKQWQDTNGSKLTDNQSDTVWVKLQRRHVDKDETWQDVPKGAVELKYNYLTGKWTDTFKRLDKTDVSNGTKYEYRVLESATGSGDDWHGGTDDDVIVISGKRYKVLNTTPVTGDSSVKTLTLTLTNRLQDAKYKLVITKQDAQDETIKLGGVAFKLEKLKNDGTVDTTETRTTGSDGTNQGKCSFTSLSPGKYRLTETKTAAGYTLLSEAIEFELTADGNCQRNSKGYGAVTQDTTSGVYNIALTIYNRKGFTLPHTGADAPSLWLLLGLPALAAVLLVLVFRYKKGGRRS